MEKNYLFTSRDFDDIKQTLRSIRQVNSRSHRFYYITTSTTEVSGNPIDPVYGEPIDIWDSDSLPDVTSGFAEFSASIVYENSRDEYLEPGALNKDNLSIDVEFRIFKDFGFSFGDMIMVDGVLYRITDIEDAGIGKYNRVIIRLEKVT